MRIAEEGSGSLFGGVAVSKEDDEGDGVGEGVGEGDGVDMSGVPYPISVYCQLSFEIGLKSPLPPPIAYNASFTTARASGHASSATPLPSNLLTGRARYR